MVKAVPGKLEEYQEKARKLNLAYETDLLEGKERKKRVKKDLES